jgi:V/A-type H+-transporting ATPase subunit I
MRRVAVVAPESRCRQTLVAVADAGCFEPDPPLEQEPNPLQRLLDGVDASGVTAELLPTPPDVDSLVGTGDLAALLGEVSLAGQRLASVEAGSCRILPGWVPDDERQRLRDTLAPIGGGVVDLPGRPGLVPPTAHRPGPGSAVRPLVSTYATVPYRDVDPTWFAAVTYLFMFGMMFGDVAHGLAIVGVGALARFGVGRLERLRGAVPFLVGAGVSATGFGLLYGEAFGPTGLVPTLWIRPLEEPETLLAAGIAVGAVLLAATFVLAIVNRWREQGPALAFYDASAVPGLLLLLAVGCAVLGATLAPGWTWPAAALLAAVGLSLTFVGLVVRAGGRGAGVAEASVELFDTVLRLGSNLISFARLAAFGLTHAVITTVVWLGTAALWSRGGWLLLAAAVLFLLGNAVSIALGALVAAVQALRLEYYELFSRLFADDGRPFLPWSIPTRRTESP